MGGGDPRHREPVIRETIVTTLGAAGRPNIAAMGVREECGLFLISPYRPSRTFDNLKRSRQAVINHTDDVRIFAGCLTGRKDWPTLPVKGIAGVRLANALFHVELEVAEWEDDEVRPRFLLPGKGTRDARRISRFQPGAGGRCRGLHPGQPTAHAAGGED